MVRTPFSLGQRRSIPTIGLLSCFLLHRFLPAASAWTPAGTASSSSSSKRSVVSGTTTATTRAFLSSGSGAAPGSETESPATMTPSKMPMPRIRPMPEMIRSETPGTWAYDTMSRRVDGEILQRTYEDNLEAFQSSAFEGVADRFGRLREELQDAANTKVTYLDDLPENATPERKRESEEWRQLLQPYVDNGDTWLSAPWMVTEFYAYRRLMQALGYWDVASPGHRFDPFLKQKRAGLSSSVGSAEAVLGKIPALPPTGAGIGIAASISLWGNRMDLSLWPADASAASVDVFSSILDKAHENLLHDDSDALAAHCDRLRSSGGGKVDIIVDNAGFELVTDLALAQYLVESGIASVVTFQLKSHPTFVSDALEKDLLETVEHYEQLDAAQYPNSKAAGKKWRQFLDAGQWVCNENSFWTQPFAMWEMPDDLRTDLHTRCDLAFVKGDANYRRLLGDRMWDYTAPFEDIVGAYFPCPVCALRTLKAELGCGMDADQVERARKMDDDWLVNGRFGVVQFAMGAGE